MFFILFLFFLSIPIFFPLPLSFFIKFFFFTFSSFLNFCYSFSLLTFRNASVIRHLFYYSWFFFMRFHILFFFLLNSNLHSFFFFLSFFVSIEILPKLIPALSGSALSSFYCRHYIFIYFFKLHLFLFISSAFLSFASLSLVLLFCHSFNFHPTPRSLAEYSRERILWHLQMPQSPFR